MTHPPLDGLRAAQVVVGCRDLDASLDFYTTVLGLRVEAISPADSPLVAVVTGRGVRLRLDSTLAPSPLRLRLLVDDPRSAGRELVAPEGTVLDTVAAEPPVTLPDLQQSLVVTRAADGAGWHSGRAGMLYRDLLPDREGGRFIASHIAIPDGGPVPDYVHYHRVRFQMIFVRRGWVRLVYEGQGEPFVMHQGDCVLQPPTIRHRVLETSSAFEVIEVGSPAVHDTHADLEVDLPSAPLPVDHEWFGQRFVLGVAQGADWAPWTSPGFRFRDTGIARATAGLAAVRVVQPGDATVTGRRAHEGELWFAHLLDGGLTLCVDGRSPEALASGDSFAVPAGVGYELRDCTTDLELLEVALPG